LTNGSEIVVGMAVLTAKIVFSILEKGKGMHGSVRWWS